MIESSQYSTPFVQSYAKPNISTSPYNSTEIITIHDLLYINLSSRLRLFLGDLEIIDTNTLTEPYIFEKIIKLLDHLPINTMTQYYKHWSVVERKGSKFKRRYLSSIIDNHINNVLSSINKEEFPAILKTHRCVFSYRENNNIKDCAENFVNKNYILSLDLKDFYFSITRKMVFQLMKDSLTEYYDRRTVRNDIDDKRIEIMAMVYSILVTCEDPRNDHLKYTKDAVILQGSSTAGAISNAILYDLDNRIEELCIEKGYVYSRYSDNFYIGSRTDSFPSSFVSNILYIINNFEYAGFTTFKINNKKIKIMPYHKHQRVLGITVNNKLNIPKKAEDILNAKISKISLCSKEEFIKIKERYYNGTIGKEQIPRHMRKFIFNNFRDVLGYVNYIKIVNVEKYDNYRMYMEFLSKRNSIYLPNIANEENNPDIINGTFMLVYEPGISTTGIDRHEDYIWTPSRKSEDYPVAMARDLDPIDILLPFIQSIPEEYYVPITLYKDYNSDLKIAVLILSNMFKYIPIFDEAMLIDSEKSDTLPNEWGYHSRYYNIANFEFQRKINTPILESNMMYNSKYPRGYVDFTSHVSSLSHIIRDNILITEVNYPPAELIFENLWYLRKNYIAGKVYLGTKNLYTIN